MSQQIIRPWTGKKPQTLTQRIIDYVMANPGKTATEVSHGLKERPSIVSGIMCRLSQETNGLVREKNAKGTWTYVRA